MKRFVLAALLALGGAVLLADTSQTYSPLAQSPLFQQRVTWTLAFTVPVVLTEAQTSSSGTIYNAACHTLRTALAAQIARNPGAYAGVFAVHLSASTAVTTAGALTGSLSAGTLDSPITDAAMFSAVSAEWSTVAGCITNP